MRRRLANGVVAIVLLSACALAQSSTRTTGTVHGTVSIVDDHGVRSVIPSVKVSLTGPTNLTVQIDDQGNFSFDSVPSLARLEFPRGERSARTRPAFQRHEGGPVMQAVIAIPESIALLSEHSAAELLTRPIAGKPLLMRTLLTASLSGADETTNSSIDSQTAPFSAKSD
jgi:hypothetical protein